MGAHLPARALPGTAGRRKPLPPVGPGAPTALLALLEPSSGWQGPFGAAFGGQLTSPVP